MYFTLEHSTPFERSVLWRLHHSYFAQRGIQAWREGDIPYFSTSNYAFARQHARLFGAVVADLESRGTLAPDADVWMLEGGCGTGIFAANFLRALEEGEGGSKELLARVRYVMSDYSEKNVRDALQTKRIARYVDLGNIVPARYDLTRPTEIVALDSEREIPPLAFVINNYICCVLPMRHLQRRADGQWYDLTVEVRAEVEDPTLAEPARYMDAITRDATKHNLMRNFETVWAWEPVEVADKFDDPMHVRVLARVVEGLAEATVGYPDRYVEYVKGVGSRMLPGALILTNDYGSTAKTRLQGLTDWRPQFYGNTFNQDVNLAIFDAVAAELGWHVLRTGEDLGSVHSAALAAEPFGPATRAAFERYYGAFSESDDLLDYSNAARGYYQKKEASRALRFYLRCADLDPDNAEHRYRVGEAAIEAGAYKKALEHLLVGYYIDFERAWDFEFQLGRAYCLDGDNPTALVWYERSSERSPHAVTHTNMGVLHAQEGRHREAYQSYKRALALDPEYERAQERLAALKDAVWEKVARDFDQVE